MVVCEINDLLFLGMYCERGVLSNRWLCMSLTSELERKTEQNIIKSNQRGGLGMLNLLPMCANQMIDIV